MKKGNEMKKSREDKQRREEKWSEVSIRERRGDKRKWEKLHLLLFEGLLFFSSTGSFFNRLLYYKVEMQLLLWQQECMELKILSNEVFRKHTFIHLVLLMSIVSFLQQYLAPHLLQWLIRCWRECQIRLFSATLLVCCAVN